MNTSEHSGYTQIIMYTKTLPSVHTVQYCSELLC